MGGPNVLAMRDRAVSASRVDGSQAARELAQSRCAAAAAADDDDDDDERNVK
jgi:hypothetical protein